MNIRYSHILIMCVLFLNNYSCTTRKITDTKVVRIIDGDTYEVLYQETNEKVRLIRIDTPESTANRKAKKDAKNSHQDVQEIKKMGIEAKNFVKSIIKPGDFIKLEFDIGKRDQYGRLLTYVFLEDGRMLNDILVREGYASPLTYPPNVKYEKRFLESFRYAREHNRGLWHD